VAVKPHITSKEEMLMINSDYYPKNENDIQMERRRNNILLLRNNINIRKKIQNSPGYRFWKSKEKIEQ
jgi:hypothetical protein